MKYFEKFLQSIPRRIAVVIVQVGGAYLIVDKLGLLSAVAWIVLSYPVVVVLQIFIDHKTGYIGSFRGSK